MHRRSYGAGGTRSRRTLGGWPGLDSARSSSLTRPSGRSPPGSRKNCDYRCGPPPFSGGAILAAAPTELRPAVLLRTVVRGLPTGGRRRPVGTPRRACVETSVETSVDGPVRERVAAVGGRARRPGGERLVRHDRRRGAVGLHHEGDRGDVVLLAHVHERDPLGRASGGADAAD